jgi:hypothetical protein
MSLKPEPISHPYHTEVILGAFVSSYRQLIGGVGEAGIIVSMLPGDRIYLHSLANGLTVGV